MMDEIIQQNNKTMQPIINQILIQPHKQKEQTLGGLILPENMIGLNHCGTVLNTGKGTKKRPMEYVANDIIYYVKDAGTSFIENGIEYRLIDSIDVLSYKRN